MQKKIMNIFIVFILSVLCFSAEAQPVTFKRKQAKPVFFVPEKELKTKKEVLPTQFRAAIPPKEVVFENNEDKSVKKIVRNDDTFDVSQYTYYSGSERVSAYKKVYDEYVKDLKHIKAYNNIPINIEKERDLGTMNSENVFKIK